MQFNWKTIFSNPETTYYLACSGGVDSMVLCYLMQKAKIPFEILHVNYQLRGKDSDLDEKLVVDYGKENQITVHVQRFDTLKIHQENGGNLEQICRDLRYNWFETFLNKNSHSKVVLAHHQDDQMETFYLQLTRKSGMVGLASLRNVRGNYVRPLLDFTKAEIYAFAKLHSIPWREDFTNQESDFRRNKLRNILLPLIENNQPDLRESVLKMIAVLQANLSEMEQEIHREVSLSNHFELSISTFQNWSNDQKNLFLQLLSIRSSVLFELDKLTTSSIGKWIESDGWMISKLAHHFSFDKIENFKIPDLKITTISSLPKEFSKTEIYLDFAKLKGNLRIRRWKDGDRISALGVNGSKLVSKIINEQHLSAYQKREVLIVEDDENIHWIVGIKIGQKAIATPSTQHIIQVQIEN